ncbi:hypothetical protein TWF173_003494 [Orbilia oligospora]|uniref:DUF7053 domain-containing protein n=1 Tax=Arthrobotrys oligospora (strain ATCC 24927 / CBS 115.81 / DSM 1491) TaxID=756982 RepID=G1X7Y4_ARTOA|nr:hypothetical protein AOL_s00054g870 [Orbilia oligospora ATCC 24927]EGX50784.1 hypothetical protein AOL_s00054g870 [Orbilia oligospora ATCC 24927]KAF3315580.1 hypothetical protein TWF173_003494 [Orbilia oligospora]
MSSYMSKRNVFTTITPLPASLHRKTVIDFFHDHQAMIDLNPLVIERHPIKAPENASADEAACIWYSLTDKVHYLPGGIASGNVSYTACFNDLPNGVQTHCRAPAGVDIRSMWSLRGSLPGEPKEPLELGITVPKEGLYIREDVDLKCNFILSSFVKKTLKKAHSVLVDRLMAKAERKEMDEAIAEQFPMGNKPITPGQIPTPVDPMGMPTHPAYMAHPNNPQYPYETSSPTVAHGNYPPSISSSDPRMSDPRMSVYSQDPRMSYQSQQSWSSYGAQPGGQLAPPGYQQPYGYAYPPVPNNAAMHSQMGFEYEQAMKRAQAPVAWNPQTGWYQPTTQAVEIASSDMMMPTDEKKKVEVKDDKKEEGNKDKKPAEQQKKKEAESDKLLEAYPQPVRANTYEMM